MLRGFSQEPFSHHELDVVPGDQHLLETVLHPADRVGNERESRAVEDGFLNAGHEAQAQRPADFSQLPEKVQIENERLVSPGPQVVEKLVHNDEQTMVGERSMERGHHLLEAPLVVGHFIGGREAVADAQRFEMLFQLRHQDVPK